METNITGLQNQDDLGDQIENLGPENSPDPDSAHTQDAKSKRRHHHEDHHVSRKYRLFSNHSSYGDSPHTNTSF